MPNPLFNALSGANQMMGMLPAYYKFANSLKGDPQAQVQDLLNSGQMTQEQYNRLQQPAMMLYSLLRGK